MVSVAMLQSIARRRGTGIGTSKQLQGQSESVDPRNKANNMTDEQKLTLESSCCQLRSHELEETTIMTLKHYSLISSILAPLCHSHCKHYPLLSLTLKTLYKSISRTL